ncbi:MAG: rhodanese-like domain-containing protein [Ignavibacteria bacterium]|nr:rhodanese-like domain-containing protein [Ignavibacteria bacterium]
MKEISAATLKQRMENEDLTLLDVRQPEEWEEFHIEGSIHIPLPDLELRVDELEQLKEKELIVLCLSGARSGQACMFLELSGFENPVNLKGGLMAFQA